jgi:hypothetical protein
LPQELLEKRKTRELARRLPYGTDESLVYVDEICQGKRRQEHFECQDRKVVFHRHEVSVGKYVAEDQDLQEYGSA